MTQADFSTGHEITVPVPQQISFHCDDLRKIASILFIAIALFFSENSFADSRKQIVGAIESVQIEEAGLSFKARVDTGAKTSSIHAENIEIDLSGGPQGKPVSFDLVNDRGESARINTTVISTETIRTSEGSEKRLKVRLTLIFAPANSRKSILVTLNDRSSMKYALLLGRNWLQGDFLVDVDRNDQDD